MVVTPDLAAGASTVLTRCVTQSAEHRAKDLAAELRRVDLAECAHLDPVLAPPAPCVWPHARTLLPCEASIDRLAVGREPRPLLDGSSVARADEAGRALVEVHTAHAVLCHERPDSGVHPGTGVVGLLEHEDMLFFSCWRLQQATAKSSRPSPSFFVARLASAGTRWTLKRCNGEKAVQGGEQTSKCGSSVSRLCHALARPDQVLRSVPVCVS